MYYVGRFYDPVIGRFLSVDPLASQLPGWSPYHYTFDNPINFIDPTGLMPEDDEIPEGIIESLSQFFDFSKIADKIKVTLFDAAEEAPGVAAEMVAEDAVKLANATVEVGDRINKATEKSAQVIGEVAGGGVAGGMIVTGFGLITKNYAVTTYGAKMIVTAGAIGTFADLTRTASRGVDAAFFDGSGEEFRNQAVKTGINFGVGKVIGTGAKAAQAGKSFWSLEWVKAIFAN